MDIRDMLTKLTLLEGSGITPGAAGAGFKATGSQGVKPTGDLKHGMPMRLNTASPTGRAPTARLPEADVEEGNRFTDKLMKARAAGKTQADLDGDGDMEPVKEAKKAKPDFLDVDNDKNRKESFKKAVADRARGKKAVKENLRLVKETALGDRSLRVYHDREYREYHVCVLEGDAVVSRQFAGSTAEATALVRSIVSEARGMKVAWPGSAEYKEKFGQDRETFRKKHAPSVMKSPAGRKELAQLDTEYEAGKKSYGRDEEGDDDEGDKKAPPTGEKRGRGRPKGSKRAIGAKGPSGRSKLLTREQQLDEISSDLALTAARRAEKKGQAYADDNLSSGPQIGYEYMQQAKRLQRGADKRRERERDDEVQAALSPAKQRRMQAEDYDQDEYDEEGEMAQSQSRTIADAAEELQAMISDNENLPEWVQKKISLAQEYIDAARDYLAANRPEDEIMAEKAVSKAQRAAAGIAHAAKKGDIPKSELRGASKEMAKMPAGELKKFAKTKEKGLPKRVKEGDIDPNRHPQTQDYGRGEDEPKSKTPAEPKKPAKKADSEEKVSETTTSGSVATAPSEGGKKSKGGIQYGKGVYEAKLAESFDAELDRVVAEGTTISINSPDSGEASVSINGTGDDAMALANLLKMAGLFSGASGGYQSACSSCGQMHEGSCGMVEEDLANSADNTETMSTDYMVNGLSGGLNGPKLQVNPNNAGDNPLAMKDLGQKSSPAVNLGAIAEQVERDAEDRLLDLYRKIS